MDFISALSEMQRFAEKFLRLEPALCLAMGIHRLGLKIPQKRRVLIIQNENPQKQEAYRSHRRLTGLALDHHVIENRLIYSHPQSHFNLRSSMDIIRLAEIIQESRAQAVIYDPHSSFHNVNEKDNVAIRNILDNITVLNKNLNIAAIMVHHFRSQPSLIKMPQNQGCIINKRLGGYSDNLNQKKHDHKDLRLLEFIKVRNGPEPEPILLGRDAFFLHHPVEANMLCSPEKMREIVRNRGVKVGPAGPGARPQSPRPLRPRRPPHRDDLERPPHPRPARLALRPRHLAAAENLISPL